MQFHRPLELTLERVTFLEFYPDRNGWDFCLWEVLWLMAKTLVELFEEQVEKEQPGGLQRKIRPLDQRRHERLQL